jgi:hypothetical protein
MVDTFTPRYNLTKPEVGFSDDTWGDKLNANFDVIDGHMLPCEASDIPPVDPVNGQLWWNSSDGRLYVWYDDGDSATFTGKVTVPPGTTGGAGFNIGISASPSAPVDGDVWVVGGSWRWRYSGSTYEVCTISGGQTINGIKTFTAKPIMTTPTTGTASINLPHGAAPTSPVNGDLWTTAAGGLFVQVSGATVGPLGAGGGAADWNTIVNKPATFPPSTHSHPTSEVTGLDTALAGKAATVHTHAQADVTSLVTDLAAKAALAGATFTGKVITATPTATDAMFNLPTTAANPSAPVNGDIWLMAGAVLRYRISTTTYDVVNVQSSQTITAAKTFSVSPILPTPTAGDKSTKGATTAYVDAADALDAKLAGATFTGAVSLPATGTQAASVLNFGTAGTGFYGTATALVGTISGTARLTMGTTGLTLGGTNFKLATVLSSTTRAGFQLPPGVAPTTPTDGDMWATAAGGVYAQVAGVSKNLSIHVGTTAPASPITNDLWLDTN